MSYRDDEKKRVIKVRDRIFGDPGGGVFAGKQRDFVLQDPLLNLWGDIRDDAISYFERNGIAWWKETNKNEPTGHVLSSQIACLNHLCFVRQMQDAASAILRNVREDIEEAVCMDEGYVEFEAVGKENYLGEKSHTRGANSTSVDAIMVGKKKGGKNILILIEWKYTEEYREDPKYIPARAKIYDPLLAEQDSPIVTDSFESLYYEPFYQLMRQVLLGWKMVQNGEYGCDEYVHLHVIPTANKELLDRVTSPGLKGASLSKAWKGVLREPERYIVISPDDLIKPASTCSDTESILNYLQERYWN